jgi:4,5-dihydroxyphthalate decarboxylase
MSRRRQEGASNIVSKYVPSLTLALGDSDLNRALLTGEVGIQGTETRCLTFSSPERHWRMFRRQEFDVAEVSFGAFLSIHARQPGEFVAVPAFPHRRFRHSFVFVAEDSKITSPADLNGKRIGLRTWTNSAGVWTRGILQDSYGLDLSSVEWVIQDADTAGMENLPQDYRITQVEAGTSIVDLACRGEVDALIYPETPDTLGAPGGLRRLFSDSRTAEIEYFRTTGVFPIMHTVALRRQIVEESPWLPYEVLRAFRDSKDRALADVRDPRKICLAWAQDAYEQQVELMGPDPFAYDAEGSRVAVETLIRYSVEQGILPKPFTLEEIFYPTTMQEPPRYVRR